MLWQVHRSNQICGSPSAHSTSGLNAFLGNRNLSFQTLDDRNFPSSPSRRIDQHAKRKKWNAAKIIAILWNHHYIVKKNFLLF